MIVRGSINWSVLFLKIKFYFLIPCVCVCVYDTRVLIPLDIGDVRSSGTEVINYCELSDTGVGDSIQVPCRSSVSS